MGGKDSKLMDDVIKVTTEMRDIICCVRKNVNDLAAIHRMKEALNQVARVKEQLDEEEKDALKTMITANSQVNLAFHFARVAVRTCKSIVETVCEVIDDENEEMSKKLKLVNDIYVQRVKELIPELKKSREELAQSQPLLKKAIGGLEILKRWCNRKISEMEGKSESEVLKQRAKVYGGLLMVVVVVEWWNPVGWAASAVVIRSAAVVAVGVATVVTEGKNVGDLRKQYRRGIESLNEAIQLFEKVSEDAEENLRNLEKKTKQMIEIAAVAQQSNANWNICIKTDLNGLMLENVKKNIFKLDKLCDDYLNAPDMPKEF